MQILSMPSSAQSKQSIKVTNFCAKLSLTFVVLNITIDVTRYHLKRVRYISFAVVAFEHSNMYCAL